jgi:hypothetical protein
MVQCKNNLPSATHYANIFPSTGRDTLRSLVGTFLHSPPMVESCAAPKAALFLVGETESSSAEGKASP